MLHTYSRNTVGRDFIVGDIHGYFSKLQAALDAIGFDPSRDRLFSVGDLVDRGPESEAVMEWLERPWFKAVRGNHEDMAIWAVRDGAARMHIDNGGGWLANLPLERRKEIVARLEQLPTAIELETADGLVAILHADCPAESWSKAKQLLAAGTEHFASACKWSRKRFESNFGAGVDGVLAVVVGHTPVERFTALGNVFYIDSGAWLARWGNRPFCILDAGTLSPVKSIPPVSLDWS